MAIAENTTPSSNSSAQATSATERVIFRSCTPDAPQKLADALASGDDAQAWRAWSRHLSRRKSPSAVAENFPGRASPLIWNLPDELNDRATRGMIERIHAFADRQRKLPVDERNSLACELHSWLIEAESASAGAAFAYQCLALGHALPALAQWLPGELWWDLFAQLHAAARQASNIYIETSPLESQLLDGELPLTLAWLFPELTACNDLLPAARRALSDGPTVLLDGEGLPHADNLSRFRPLLACWARARNLGDSLAGGCWNDAAEEQFHWAVRQAWRLMRHDGSQCLTDGPSGAWCKPLFSTIVALLPAKQLPFAKAGWPIGHPPQKLAGVKLPKPPKPKKSPEANNGDQASDSPENILAGALPSVHSEWSELGVMRPSWSAKDPQLAVAYADGRVQLELSRGRKLLLGGPWTLEVQFDGQALATVGNWEEVWWIADDDCDYLELEIKLGASQRVQRQILLSRRDRFLLAADAVLGTREGRIEYRSTLPLAADVQFATNDETREGHLMANKLQALILPLALAEWRIDPRGGRLSAAENQLELNQSAIGLNLFCPLWLDLDPKRLRKPCTWRQLTVAQNRAIQLPDVAVGYRVQVGHRQWLVYRSLAARGNRTLLGHNLSTEFLCARFDKQGEVHSVLEIE